VRESEWSRPHIDDAARERDHDADDRRDPRRPTPSVKRTRIAASDCDCVHRIAATCGESPMWSVREQALYWTDNLGGQIYRLEPECGSDQSFGLGDNVMSIGLRQGGGLVLALAKQFAYYEPGGELELLMGVELDQPRNRFNDGKVDRRGRYWAGTMNDIDWDDPSGSLYRLDPGLEVSRVQGAVVCANGLGWSPDNRTFYFCESFRYAIFAYDFDPDEAALSARRVQRGVPGRADGGRRGGHLERAERRWPSGALRPGRRRHARGRGAASPADELHLRRARPRRPLHHHFAAEHDPRAARALPTVGERVRCATRPDGCARAALRRIGRAHRVHLS
jgi:SMP-30/Gluconolactonase/LRE-like region